MPQSSDEAKARLKEALWYHIGKAVDREAMARNMNATPQYIAALTELVWTQIENVAIDLEAFSRHAGRTTITTDDVLLIARRNSDLAAILKDAIDKKDADKTAGASEKAGSSKVNKGKGKA